MAQFKNKDEVKEKRYSVRLTKDMDRLISIVAKERGITVAKYLRDSGIILAEMSTDEKELYSMVKEEDRSSVQKTFHLLFQETKDIVVNSSQGLFDKLSERIDRLERFVEIILYVYLFHTPEVKESEKQKSKKSAQERKKKVMKILNESEISNVE
jgi:hypothetical protein